ncbi:MAG: hypothetical protein AAGA96_10755 [Verrucomicrobiota bacterium]
MTDFTVTRAHLKNACEKRQWDLLDKLLELDVSGINDKSLFTDTWGSWWGMLLECVLQKQVDGVRVLLAHGADRELAMWGDGFLTTPREAAENQPEILALLDADVVTYKRRNDPPLPTEESDRDRAINRQGEVRDGTGLVLPLDGEP